MTARLTPCPMGHWQDPERGAQDGGGGSSWVSLEVVVVVGVSSLFEQPDAPGGETKAGAAHHLSPLLHPHSLRSLPPSPRLLGLCHSGLVGGVCWCVHFIQAVRGLPGGGGLYPENQIQVGGMQRVEAVWRFPGTRGSVAMGPRAGPLASLLSSEGTGRDIEDHPSKAM